MFSLHKCKISCFVLDIYVRSSHPVRQQRKKFSNLKYILVKMNQTMRNIKEFWAWCVGSDRRSGHEPAESSNSALDLKHEADVPPAYSARPLGFNEPRMHPNSAILETGSALV